MRYVDGVVLEGQDVALTARLVELGVDRLQRVNGTVPPDALRMRDELAMFARRSSLVQVTGNGAHANVLDPADPAASVPQATVAEAAEQTGYSAQHIRRMCASGALAAIRSAAGHWQIDGWSLEKLAAQRRNMMQND